MDANDQETKLAHELTHSVNDALNRRIEERFRAALLLVNPTLDMEKVTVISNVENDNELLVDGIDDETVDQAMAIFEEQGDE
ncbi:hypothetical protein HNV11_21390 [Spirosoma taeanense]|uniref:Uncharacterized protein n=1 Tax=Spirosoma taeanense TaxID=2735870 RepID=A0A6M5YFF7_9BACT|nr:hypothetical protein [Spirosoma taeanense]QJW91752.1 hypothetical protein HNV11_21390 [Spirosoma taeanense]